MGAGLREAFTKTRAKTALEGLFGQKKGAPLREKGEETSGTQRLMEFGGAAAPSALKEAPGSVVVGE